MSKHNLYVFDFDKTLVATPEPEIGITAYEMATGKKWAIHNVPEATRSGFEPHFRRTGWWGRAETLLPPIMPRPTPPEFFLEAAKKGYEQAKADPLARITLVTGRHSKLGAMVKEIVGELGMAFDEYYFKGSREIVHHPKHPKNNDTPDYKVFMVRDYLTTAETQNVVLWEDRVDIVERFVGEVVPDLRAQRPNVQLIAVHDVTTPKAYFYPPGGMTPTRGDLAAAFTRQEG